MSAQLSVVAADFVPDADNSRPAATNHVAPPAVEVLPSARRMRKTHAARRAPRHRDTDEEAEVKFMSVFNRHIATVDRLSREAEKVFEKESDAIKSHSNVPERPADDSTYYQEEDETATTYTNTDIVRLRNVDTIPRGPAIPGLEYDCKEECIKPEEPGTMGFAYVNNVTRATNTTLRSHRSAPMNASEVIGRDMLLNQGASVLAVMARLASAQEINAAGWNCRGAPLGGSDVRIVTLEEYGIEVLADGATPFLLSVPVWLMTMTRKRLHATSSR